MAPTRRRRVSGSAHQGHLRRTTEWHGLGPGDPVAVTGTRLRSASWTFVAHVHNTVSGEESIEVVGGRPGDRKIRSFRPDQVFPPSARRGPGPPSLADVPQLPLH